MAELKRRTRGDTDLREVILVAAKTIIIHEGFAALSMRRLAQEIGYSATTIYLYFKNREAVVAALGRSGLEVLETFVTTADTFADSRESLREFARQYLRFSREHSESYRMIFMQDSTLSDAMFRSESGKDAGGAGERVFGLLIAFFKRLQTSDPNWKNVKPALAAEVFWTSLHGIISLKLTCGKFLQTSGEDLTEVAVNALIAGMPGTFANQGDQ